LAGLGKYSNEGVFKDFYAIAKKTGEVEKVPSNAYISLNTKRRNSKSQKYNTLLPAAKKLLKYENDSKDY